MHVVTVRDEFSGEPFTIAARCIALCVGVWAPEASAIFTGAAEAVSVTRSKGVHLRLPRTAIDGETALIIPTGKSVLFVIPTPTHWLVGTTDTEWLGDPDSVEPTADDVEYLLGLLCDVLAHPVTAADVTYTFAGLRPLVRDQSVGGNTAKVTREHRIARVAPGVLAIVGGKWTTYRVMARDLVDTVLVESGLPKRECITQTIPLVDTRDAEVAALIADDETLASPVMGAPGYTQADVVQAVVHEGAFLLDDVIDRRLRLHLMLDAVSDETLDDVAAVMSGVRA